MDYDWEKSNALLSGKLYSNYVMQSKQDEQCCGMCGSDDYGYFHE
jgi:hypothetical protein